MKQKNNHLFILPKRKPKTLRGVLRWHRNILELTMYLEFKAKSLKASINVINTEISEYTSLASDPKVCSAAKLTLNQLNKLKKEFSENLEIVKETIKIAHDTNEHIIASVLKSVLGDEFDKLFDIKKKYPGTNLLHGTKGWLQEVASADLLIKKGTAAFITFGTIFDPSGFDIVTVGKLSRRVKVTIWPKCSTRRRGRNETS